MSETEIFETQDKSTKNIFWPPNEEQIMNIAASALNKSQDKDIKVLVYWENDPNLMIFNPFYFAQTDYIKRKYEHNERTVEVNIGRID